MQRKKIRGMNNNGSKEDNNITNLSKNELRDIYWTHILAVKGIKGQLISWIVSYHEVLDAVVEEEDCLGIMFKENKENVSSI